MKIAIVGAHSCGKTTLCYHVAAQLKSLDKSVGIVIEQARLCPFKLGTREAAEWMIINQVKSEIEMSKGHEITVTDRSTLDPIAYANTQGDWCIYKDIEALAYTWAYTYDVIIFLEPSRPIVDDGFRDTDIVYRQRIHEEFVKLLNAHPHTNIKFYKNNKASCERDALELVGMLYDADN